MFNMSFDKDEIKFERLITIHFSMARKVDLGKGDVASSVGIGLGLDLGIDTGFMPSGYFWRGSGVNGGLMKGLR